MLSWCSVLQESYGTMFWFQYCRDIIILCLVAVLQASDSAVLGFSVAGMFEFTVLWIEIHPFLTLRSLLFSQNNGSGN